jgi:hypothetical protein
VITPDGHKKTVITPDGHKKTVVTPDGHKKTVVTPDGHKKTVVTPDGRKYHVGYHMKMPSKDDLGKIHAEITRRHSHNQDWAILAQPYRHNGSVDWEDDYYNKIRKQEIEAGLDIN